MFRRIKHSIKLRHLLCCTVLVIILQLFGVLQLLFEKDFHTDFHYPYDGDFSYSAYQLRMGLKPDIPPINQYNYAFIHELTDKCKTNDPIRIVYLIKSSPENFYRRSVIRATWGYEQRFSDVEIQRVFMLGYRDDPIQQQQQEKLNQESAKFGDILQSNFTDVYYNNTIKTMMGFKWAVQHCNTAKFYMFVDDDYYVSTKNVLRFVRNPTNYPEYIKGSLKSKQTINHRRRRQLVDMELPNDVKLYAGYVFNTKPLRHYFTKFYIGLAEYPYNRWPPYVTAGAYLLSREALMEMYYASFYTQHFRFDDIYVALLALRTNIEPFHSDEFYMYKKEYSRDSYTFTVASHGFSDPVELITAWNEQKSAGNA